MNTVPGGLRLGRVNACTDGGTEPPTVVDCDGCGFGPRDYGSEYRATEAATEHATDTGHSVSTYPRSMVRDYYPGGADVEEVDTR